MNEKEKKNRKGRKKRRWLWIIVGLAAVGVVGGCGICLVGAVVGPDMDVEVGVVGSATPGPSPTPAATLALRDRVISEARGEFGDSLRGVEVSMVEGLTCVTVDYDLGVVWDETDAVRRAIMDLIHFAPDVFGVGEFDVLEMRSVTVFEDVYGNEENEVAFRFTITAAAVEKVNWDNVDPHRLGYVLELEGGCGVYVHPSLQGAWVGYQD